MRSAWLMLLIVAACSTPRPDGLGSAAADLDGGRDAGQIADPWTSIGESLLGRPIRRATVGVGPRKVIWVGGIHGNEREGSVATANLLRSFMAAGDLESKVTLTIIEDINPDGTNTRTRGNSRGVDLNRNFPASNARPGTQPLSEPEARVLHDLILEVQPDLVIVAHSWGEKARGPKQFINFDGPAADLARLFSVISGYEVVGSRGIAPTPGSLGTWVGIDQQRPILTLEYRRGVDPEQAWQETREAILAVIRG